MRSVTLVVLALWLPGSGCGGSQENLDDALADTPDSAEKVDGVERPLGSYESFFDEGMLALKSDRAFIEWSGGDPSGRWSIARGTYTFTTAGSTRYLRLTVAEPDPLSVRFAYRLEGDTLFLRVVGDVQWMEFSRTNPKCVQPSDCELQGRRLARAHRWTCDASYHCVEKPQPGPPPEP